MRKTFLLFVIALACAPASFAQTRDYSFYEFYVGYAHERADNGADRADLNATRVINGARADFVSQRTGYNGFNVEFNQNVTRHIGIVTNLSGTYDRVNYVDRLVAGRTIGARLSRYDLLAGPRYNWRYSGATPFVHALFGISHVQTKFDGPLLTGTRSDTAFAMAFGGGVDVHAGNHIDIRPGEIEYLPTFFNSRHQDNFRFSAGVKIK